MTGPPTRTWVVWWAAPELLGELGWQVLARVLPLSLAALVWLRQHQPWLLTAGWGTRVVMVVVVVAVVPAVVVQVSSFRGRPPCPSLCTRPLTVRRAQGPLPPSRP